MMLMQSELSGWANVAVAAVLGAIAIAISVSRRSQERQVTINPDMATKHEVKEVRDNIEAHKMRTSEQVKDVHNKIERVQGEINKNIQEMNREMGGLAADTKLQNQSLAEIRADVKRLIGRGEI